MSRRSKKRIYNIILTNHGKELRSLASDSTEAKIYRRFEELLKENEKVKFPVKYNHEEKAMVESSYELVIIKCKQENDQDVNKVRDEYGKYIDYQTNDEERIVIDRAFYNIEETFWVYGYHPKIQRKTFDWIFDNFISKDSKNKYMFKSVQVFLNKVLIDCNGKLEMIICKNKSDAIRLYNTIEEYSLKNKYKYVAFMGDVSRSKYKKNFIDRIQAMTNWDRKKISRNSTRA